MSELEPLSPEDAVREFEHYRASKSRRNCEYKILTQKDKWLSNKFDPNSVEKALNGYATQGFRVRAGDSATFPGFLREANELIVILERDGDMNMKFEYKVLTQKDKWFSGKFDPASLEKAINSYAQQGWHVVLATTASFPGFFSTNREEMVIILERQRD